jgi:protein-tyrosine phosphatase
VAFRAVEIGVPEVGGRLWLASMPGRFETWQAFLAEAGTAKLSLVLCLTPRHEIERLARSYHAAIDDGTLPFRWLHVPMQDFGLAAQIGVFRDGIEAAGHVLRDGGAVLIHCAAGIGRTGTAAACLLRHLGVPTAVALRRVRDAGSDPESALQSGLVETF